MKRFCLSALMLLLGLVVADRFPSSAYGKQIGVDVSLAHPTILSGEKQLNYLKVKLSAFELASSGKRPPVNVAIVLDKSGSMSGTKIEQAKKAAFAAVDRLKETDIVSIVVYDDSVEVLVPATRASDRAAIQAAIAKVQAGGGTALFAGVSKGAAEVRKFMDEKHVNRVILLSDGLANQGPSSPSELEQLGKSLLKEGVSVSTLGLGSGYNEDLMTSLAAASSGNHVFIENSDNLVAVFNNEFDDLLNVVASDLEVNVKVHESIRPVRVLGSKADITGQTVHLQLCQLYSKQERYFILEVEVASGNDGAELKVADVTVSYRNMQTETIDQLSSTVALKYSSDKEKVAKDGNVEAIALSAVQLAAERNKEATALRDAGKVDEAKKLLVLNTLELAQVSDFCKVKNFSCPEVGLGCKINAEQAKDVADNSKWNSVRKRSREYQNQTNQQQTYDEFGKVAR